MCCGCNRSIRPKPVAKEPEIVPPEPFDVVLAGKERRMYHKPGGELTYSVRPQNCYYEKKIACKRKMSSLLQILLKLIILIGRNCQTSTKPF